MQITAKRELRLLQWKIIKKQPSVSALTNGDVAVCTPQARGEGVKLSSPPAPYPDISLLEEGKWKEATAPVSNLWAGHGFGLCLQLPKAKTGSIFPI